jgi:uncharacterized protein with HEPN domain
MSREYRLYLEDIVSSAQFIEQHTGGLTYDDFVSEEIRLYAVLHHLTIIGEAVKHIPDEIRQRLPEVPWQEIAGTRDIIVHNYFSVKLPIIWHAVESEVLDLRLRIESLLSQMDSEGAS